MSNSTNIVSLESIHGRFSYMFTIHCNLLSFFSLYELTLLIIVFFFSFPRFSLLSLFFLLDIAETIVDLLKGDSRSEGSAADLDASKICLTQ
jgi:hypothetical protein